MLSWSGRKSVEKHLYEKRRGKPNSVELQVARGTHVEVELLTVSGKREALGLDIVADQDADFSLGFLGMGTPLAQAILGHYAGSRVPYQKADFVEVRILAVTPSQATPSGDAALNRQAVIDEAVSKSNLADTVRLALAVDVKWGGYDPAALEENWDK
jgi:hypothetical protein